MASISTRMPVGQGCYLDSCPRRKGTGKKCFIHLVNLLEGVKVCEKDRCLHYVSHCIFSCLNNCIDIIHDSLCLFRG